MCIRKIQNKKGSNVLLVTIPKEIVKKMGLEKGQYLNIDTNENKIILERMLFSNEKNNK